MNMKIIGSFAGIPDGWYEKQYWNILKCIGCKESID